MRVDELLSRGECAVNTQTVVSGRLFVNGENASFLAADLDAFLNGNRVTIIDDSIIAHSLLKELPAYGDGPCIYDEDCTMNATLRHGSDGYELVDVRSCVVTRDETIVDLHCK